MLGLYIHIPFCAKKCHYCNFVITLSGDPDQRGLFLSALAKEAAHEAPHFEGRSFDTLYFGGGTPSVLSADETERLFRIIRGHFHVKEDAEITWEANPGDADKEKVSLYRSLGTNRVSLGAQSFNDATLKRLNRSHDAGDIRRSFQLFRDGGFGNINLDLILSLPRETLGDVERSLTEAVRLGPDHISLYELAIEEGTRFGRQFKQGTLALPDEALGLQMLSFARQYLKNEGYRHYELLNYARPGFESRHNLLYWSNEEYLGLGPGAFSYVGGRRSRTSATVGEYLRKMEKGDWAAREEEMLDTGKKEIESFLLALRLTEGASLSRFRGLVAKFNRPIRELSGKGLLAETENKIRLTPRGQFFAETVFAELSSLE